MNILIADDDQVYLKLVSTRLRTKGFRVTTVVDGMQAFMTAVREPPDAILLDVKMPGGTGIDTLKKLKALGKTSLIPVIVISGVNTPDLARTVHDLGGAAFLPKPVRFGPLYAALCNALGIEPQPDVAKAPASPPLTRGGRDPHRR
jgi:DNA-binding response OmpR family regulator